MAKIGERPAHRSSNGGGISCLGASAPFILNNTIRRNRVSMNGGGIYCRDSSPAIFGNRIERNTAYAGPYAGSVGGGGVFCLNAAPVIAGNVIARNTAGPGHDAFSRKDGGGIACIASFPTITNNTITENQAIGLFLAQGRGGGLFSYSSSPLVTNTIFWSDTPDEIRALSGGATVTYSDVQGGHAGRQPEPRPPLPRRRLRRLPPLCGSPAIDAGTNAALGIPAADVEGESRIADGDSIGAATVDMGADEFHMLWAFRNPATVGGAPVDFTAMAPPAESGNTAFLFLSLGDAACIPLRIPGSAGRCLRLAPDAVFSLWVSLPQVLRVVALSPPCPGGTTFSFQVPATAPVGLRVFYAGFSVDGSGFLVSVTPTNDFLTR